MHHIVQKGSTYLAAAAAVAMDSPGASGRRRGAPKLNAEDQALDQIAKEVMVMLSEPPNMVKIECDIYCGLMVGIGPDF